MLFALFHAESGRSDVVNTISDFVFTPASRSAFENFAIVDDDVLEFDEIFIAEFSFSPEIANNWNARKGEPITAFILIRDDDCELCSDSSNHLICTIFPAPKYIYIYIYIYIHIYIYIYIYIYVQQYCFGCTADTLLL